MNDRLASTSSPLACAGGGPSLAVTLVLTAAAGGMGWGIRGQYGHESGAMIAGLLVALVVGGLYCRGFSSLAVARMAALAAVGVSFGGAMTYGQTVGLTHDADVVGNWAALRWGMLGLAIKGGVWIGFAGLLMGVGLGGKRYDALEMLLVFFVLMGLHLLGVYLLNEPFHPEARQLPRVFFSGDWRWFPQRVDLEPRRECWGGYVFSLAGLWAYVAFVKRDAVARNLALCAVLAGAVGFPLGQSVQAYHAWNRDAFQTGWLGAIEPYMNWWNTMETIFGMTAGAGLGLGVWLCRARIALSRERLGAGAEGVDLRPAAEVVLALTHVAAITVWNFAYFPPLDRLADGTLAMGMLPLAMILGGRYGPYLMALPIVALPICGKTLRELAYYNAEISRGAGWLVFVLLPLAATTGLALYWAKNDRGGQRGQQFARQGLLLASWLYFWLNFGFFRFPWPWMAPTPRTPSAIVFSACLLLLTAACFAGRLGGPGAKPPAAGGFAPSGG
ncbi:MAG: hypothetical protein DCC67_00230 [Planctomycetota bacterium]|nr:MAG: hypothetical protein DCC67_00230 [Planctomycetota bacterium]